MRLLAILAALVVIVAACGGGSAPPVEHAAETTTTVVATADTEEATTSPQTTSEPTTTQTTAKPTATITEFDPLPVSQNWLQVSVDDQLFLSEEPELCLIHGDGASGTIRTTHLALEWDNDEWMVTWNQGGVHEGPIDGSVDGLAVSFNGIVDEFAIRGEVFCIEP